MTREELTEYILETYNADRDHPWEKHPGFTVFRHANNKKWFALIMDIPRCKIGLSEDGMIDVVNLKCDPLLIGYLRQEIGFFPVYHMNKANWITVALDGTAPDERIKEILDMSYEATAGKMKRHSRSDQLSTD